jgi:hypothetical protein
MFAVIGAIGLIWQELEMIQGTPLFQYSKQANDYDKDRSFRDLWLQFFVSQRVTKLSKLFEFIIITP